MIVHKEFEEAIAALLSHLIARAKSLAEQWWRETARPAIESQRAKMSDRRARRKAQKKAAIIQGAVVEPPQDMVPAPQENRPNMSSAEAQARYLAALAARAYSDEQLRLVTNANIVDAAGIAELKRSLAELPPERVKGLLDAMATNPSLLSEETLAELASLLGRRAL
ncbi:hypothetical protein [Streptomyces sp. NPDC001508]|uniref:hypothetical protein n=1 Tax=Streptomyces sp. NPDC001508 TaxID=3154656 RepID=UPI0033322AE7